MSDHDHDHASDPAMSRLNAAANEGCRESRLLLSRRAMLGMTAGLFSSAFLPDMASAAVNGEARFLVVILRGGMDGLNMMVPKLDPLYVSKRRHLSIPFSSTLSLGSDFGLHPAMPGLHALFQAGDVALIPAAGIPLKNRSHFDCQDNLENGLPKNTSNATGWLNRLLGALPVGDPIRTRRGIEIGDKPVILSGPEPVLGWSPTWFEKAPAEFKTAITGLYRQTSGPLFGTLVRGLQADALALASGAGNSQLSTLRKGFVGAARLLRQASGPRIAVLSIDGWDTHSGQGVLTGEFADRLRELDQAIADLKRELGGIWANTVCSIVTEFGRTVDVNGDNGTDHGIATVAAFVGGAVRGGIKGDWPGLATAQLHEGRDLRATVDLRSAFKGVLRDHLGVAPSILEATVFPASLGAAPLAGLVKSPQPTSASARIASTPQPERHVSPIAAYRTQALAGL